MGNLAKQILVLCTGNSCRSIMAEALINHLGAGHYEAVSAGSFPTGTVHPKALETLDRHGIPYDQPRSQSWNDFTDTDLNMIITVCDQAVGESCPVFPHTPQKLHWSTPDPAKASGSAQDINTAFEQAFLMLKDRIEGLINGNA